MTEPVQKKDRKRLNVHIARIVTAILVFLFLVFWIINNGSPLRGNAQWQLSGEGSYGVAFDGDGTEYVQGFVPRYNRLESLSILVDAVSFEDADGSVELLIADKTGQVLAKKELLAKELSWGRYTDVPMALQLHAGESYSLRLISHISGVDTPQLLVCSTDYELKEHVGLFGGKELADTQLVARYVYGNVLEPLDVVKALFLAVLLVTGIAAGLPENVRLRRVVAALLLVAGPLVLGRQLELLLPTNVLLPHAMKWNIGIMYLFEIIVLLCTFSTRFTIVFCNVLLTVLYCANYFVQAYRGTYLKLNELTAVQTAAEVMGNYSFVPNREMAFIWLTAGVLAIWGMGVGTAKVRRTSVRQAEILKVQGDRERSVSPKSGMWLKWGLRVASLAAGIGLACVSGHFLIGTELLMEHGFSYYSGINQEYTYYFDGYLVGSMLNIRHSRIEEPTGYSQDAVWAVLSEYKGETGKPDEELPHIILIMNESWSDLRVNGNLEISQENFAFTNSLQENTLKGYVNTSVLGGGTANSEFEVFTGCSMGFLPDSYYAYQQAVTGPMDSLVSNLENKGYTTYSMHPEKATNWRRKEVYDYLGFDTRLWKEDFEGAEEIHSGVSDAETFGRVQELYENRASGEKMFIFDLTMQNHGYYRDSNVERTVEAVNVDCDEADIFLSLMYETDRAFEELITYFEKQDEKVVICMFGDHQPKFESSNFYEDIYAQTEGLTEETKKLNLYKTPFVIWANYDIEEAEGLDISTNYLGVLVQQAAGVELTPYFAYLRELMEEYPVITVNGYVNRDGEYKNWSGTGEEFPEYRMLQYNYLFDRNIVKWGYGADTQEE